MAASRRRLAFDELFRLEVALAAQQRHRRVTSKGIVHDAGRALATHFVDHLPFRLTVAQVRALEEIDADLASADPMHRLLQGEVGSGKTVVAVAALLAGVEGGYQGAVMAPTEVLAGQHFLSITALLDLAGNGPRGRGRRKSTRHGFALRRSLRPARRPAGGGGAAHRFERRGDQPAAGVGYAARTCST